METREVMTINDIRKKNDFKKFFLQWEWMLVLIFIIINIITEITVIVFHPPIISEK